MDVLTSVACKHAHNHFFLLHHSKASWIPFFCSILEKNNKLHPESCDVTQSLNACNHQALWFFSMKMSNSFHARNSFVWNQHKQIHYRKINNNEEKCIENCFQTMNSSFLSNIQNSALELIESIDGWSLVLLCFLMWWWSMAV